MTIFYEVKGTYSNYVPSFADDQHFIKQESPPIQHTFTISMTTVYHCIIIK